MRPYLMGDTGVASHLHQSDFRISTSLTNPNEALRLEDWIEVRLAEGRHRHFPGILRIMGERIVYLEGVPARVPPAPGKVDFFDPLFFEVISPAQVRLRLETNDEHPRCPGVQAMGRESRLRLRKSILSFRVAGESPMGHGTRIGETQRMRSDAGGLVDHDKIGAPMDNGNLQVAISLSKLFQMCVELGKIQRLDLVALFHRPSIGRDHESTRKRFLDLISGEPFVTGTGELVGSRAHLFYPGAAKWAEIYHWDTMDAVTKTRRWSLLINRLREHLEANGFIEVFTNNLVPAGAFEASLDCLKVAFEGGEMELHTSPEIEMKRLLSEIRQSAFQITKCYRDDPPTGIHWKEFTMLEFYRVEAGYERLIDDMKGLIEACVGHEMPFDELTVQEAFQRFAGIDLANSPDLDEDTYFKCLIEKVEPALDPKRPTILRDYPASQCTLGKIDSSRNIVERFEIYWEGMELCNGCTELTDLEELNRRYEIESEKRKRRGKSPHPYPDRLAEALKRGLPPMAGVAVGVDRLFLSLFGRGTV